MVTSRAAAGGALAAIRMIAAGVNIERAAVEALDDLRAHCRFDGQKTEGGSMTDRDDLGRFAPGNAGGPGRPRRAVEREYLAALADCVTLDDWRAIVGRAVVDAKAGDGKAREWVARHVLGADPASLTALAVREALGVPVDDELAAEARRLTTWVMPDLTGKDPVLSAAVDAIEARARAARDAAAAEARRAARAEREARKAAASTTSAGTGDDLPAVDPAGVG